MIKKEIINVGKPNGQDEYVEMVRVSDLKDLKLYVYKFYVGSNADDYEGFWATSEEEADGYFWQYIGELGVDGHEAIIEECYEYKIPLED